jgi:predicted AAA+ superfamily ATPase
VIQPKLNININKDDGHLNDFLYCWSEFGLRPNKIVVYNTYSTVEFNNTISEMIIDKNVFTEIIPSDSSFVINDKMFVKIDDGLYLSYIVIDRNQENSIINEISFFYKDFKEGSKKVKEIIEKLNSCIVDFCEEEGNNLNTISYNNGSLEIEPIDNSKCDIDNFDMYYSNDTFKNVKKLIKKIKRSDKGLSILYGERGTGKTSVINYISSKLDRIVIFIPNNMIEQTINNPDFRKFIKKYYKPVIIIDDCEMMFNEAFAKSNIFVNNLLQMVDGFLSDSVEANIVLIFNVEDEDEIDHSLLDCNNLIDKIKFEELTSDESTELSKHIGHNKSYKNKTKLVDIIKGRKTKDKTNIGL